MNKDLFVVPSLRYIAYMPVKPVWLLIRYGRRLGTELLARSSHNSNTKDLRSRLVPTDPEQDAVQDLVVSVM